MKRFTYVFVAFAALIFTGCAGDDIVEGSGRVDIEDLMDDWKLLNSTNPDFRECMVENEIPVLIIGNSSIQFPVTSSLNGCQIDSAEFSYAFDGSNIFVNFDGNEVIYFVDFVDSANFSWTDNIVGFTDSFERIQ